MKRLDIFLSVAVWLCVYPFPVVVVAHDASMPHHEWYNQQEINPAARQRLDIAYKSCCDSGDVYKTRFRVGADNSDQWQYLKEGQWKVIPPDIIKEEDTPDREPVLFINKYDGRELCFFVPKGGT